MRVRTALVGISSLSFSSLAVAVTFFTNATVPNDLTSSCTNALLADVSCDPVVPAFQAGNFYPNNTLQRACTSSCAAALEAYQTTVNGACSGQGWLGYSNVTMPVSVIPDLLRYHYNFICLTDTGRFCNNVAAAYAAYLDPITAADPNRSPAGGMYGNITVTDECDLCLVKNLQFQAGSPYYDGPDLYSSSVYQSKTSSCGIDGYPLVTTTNTISIPSTTTAEPAPTCAGQTYTITEGDDCHSISQSNRISTSWLLQDNQLAASCANFPTSGKLCLVNQCDVYTVKANDTCASIASGQNVTEAQFKAWNPNINAGCYNIEQMVGDQMCVGQPGTTYVPPSITSSMAPPTPTVPAPVPSNMAEGTNINCGQFYEVILGEYCNLLVVKFGISLDDFTFLNPAVNENCTNLYADESYCVQAVGDINTYSGRPGYNTHTATITSIDGDQATKWPDATWTTPMATATISPLPLAKNTRADCYKNFDGSFYEGYGSEVTDIYGSICGFAASVLDVTLEDLGVWNPSLGNTSLSTCAFDPELRYCGVYYLGQRPVPTPIVDDGSPIREGTVDPCDAYVDVYDGSGWTCQGILDDYSLTIAQFYSMNPSVGSDCAGLWLGYRYCVAVPGSSTTTTSSSSPATTTTPTAPGPTQAGQPANCNTWYVAQDGDSCDTVISKLSITAAQFYSWNPAVSTTCDGFWKDYSYCVGTTDTITPTTTTTTTTSKGTTTTPAVPGPTQTGQPANCNKWYVAQDGDSCDAVIIKLSITADHFYSWNPAVSSSDCSGFWKDYAYCIGTTDTATTTKSTTTTTTATTTRTTTTSATIPGPTQAGQPADCNKWYVAQDGDSCAAVINEFFITADQFYSWNPAVSSSDCGGFWKDYAYCIGTTDTASVTRTTTTSVTPTPTAVAPDPHFDNNFITSCNKFAQAQSGDYCYLFAQNNGITTAQLFAWNAVLGENGSGCDAYFWVDYWWCVGVS